MNRTALSITVWTAFIAMNVSAQLSRPYQQWGNTAVRYLMMKQEKTDWALLKSDADAKKFIDVFWARRDPTADTPVNELRQQFEKRTAEADERYRVNQTPGSLTDRGLVYVLLGPASQILNRAVPPSAPVGSLGQLARPINVESWIYRNEAAERPLGTKSFEIVFAFHDERFPGEFELDETSQKAFESSALNVAKSVLKRPFLTQADLAGGESGRTVALRLIVVADNAIAHEVLRRAQEGQDFATLARQYSSQPSAQRGGYVGRVAFADLTDDFKMALAGKEPGATVLIPRTSQFAIVRLLTEAEAAAAEAEMAKPK